MPTSACQGQICLSEVIVQYFENGVCSFATYRAIECPYTYIFVDADCNLALDNCNTCVNCLYGSGFGASPTLGSMETTHIRKYQKSMADAGTRENITSISLRSNAYTIRRMGVYRIRTAADEARLVELVWVGRKDNPNDGFGVGYELRDGEPIEELRGQRLGERGYAVAVANRQFNVFLRR
jgi:hypothetical protein